MRLLRHSALVSVLLLLIVGCVGGGGGGGSSPDEQTQSLVSVTGAFVDDMPVARAVITVIDAQGVTREAITDDNGLYYMEVNDLTLPLLVVGTYTQAGVVHSQYAFVSADKATADSVTANINEYTTLLVAAMAQDAGVALDTAPEALDDTVRNNMLGVDYLPTIASMEELFCSVLLNPDGTPQGCEWGASEDLLSTPYAPTVDGNAIDKLVALMDITVDLTTGDVIVADSTGVTIATVSLADIIAGTIPADTLTPTDAANLEAVYTPPATITPIENEDVVAQVSTDGRVRGYVDYYSNALTADIMIENLSSCPGERRNLVVTPGVNAATPSLIFPDYDTFDVLDRSIGNIGPIDACRPYAFDYQFDYNLVIRKTQTGLVDGVPVWTYDVPVCEQYSNKTLEKILQETYQDTSASFATSFSQPYIEVRPALYRYSEAWPDSSVNFVYEPTCPMLAEFSITPTSGVAPLTVSVDASGSVGSDIVSYSWSTSDGQAATGLTSSLTFTTAGTHTITLTIANSGGVTEFVTKTVTVDPVPVAGFTWSTGASLQINLDASSSTGAGITSYQWSASDGQTATAQSASFTFAAAGSYSVTLTITDRNGETSAVTQVVVAEEIQPSSCATIGNLMWEVKTDDGGVRDVDNTYNWYDPSLTGYWEEATFGTRYPEAGFDVPPTTYDYVQSVNALNLCGYNNWRMPTISELESLVITVSTLSTAHIDTQLFPNTTWGSSGSFWSGTSEDVITFRAWAVNFNDGVTYSYVKDGGPEQVRLVRTVQ